MANSCVFCPLPDRSKQKGYYWAEPFYRTKTDRELMLVGKIGFFAKWIKKLQTPCTVGKTTFDNEQNDPPDSISETISLFSLCGKLVPFQCSQHILLKYFEWNQQCLYCDVSSIVRFNV